MEESKFIVERLKTEHLKTLIEVENLSFSDPWSLSAFKEEIKNKLANYIVVVEKDKVVAYGGFWKVVDEAHITNVAVHPDYRGNKLGDMILGQLVKDAVEMGLERMTLEVRAHNMVAQGLYRKFGFVLSGIRPGYYRDNQEDAYIMWKELKEEKNG